MRQPLSFEQRIEQRFDEVGLMDPSVPKLIAEISLRANDIGPDNPAYHPARWVGQDTASRTIELLRDLLTLPEGLKVPRTKYSPITRGE
jgi:hypothetical protein